MNIVKCAKYVGTIYPGNENQGCHDLAPRHDPKTRLFSTDRCTCRQHLGTDQLSRACRHGSDTSFTLTSSDSVLFYEHNIWNLCWSCSFMCSLADPWRHFLMKQIWEESRFLVMLLWMYHVTKRRFIVLMNAPFGTIALGESFRRLMTAQALLGTRVRGATTIGGHVRSLLPALQKDLYWHY